MDNMIMDKMTINLDVFSLFMEDIIVSNMNITLVVKINRSSRDVDTPKSLRSYRSQRSLDVVSARAGYSALVPSRPHESVSYFAKKSKKNQKESNNQWWTCDQWDLLPNQHQKMHGEQEETE